MKFYKVSENSFKDVSDIISMLLKYFSISGEAPRPLLGFDKLEPSRIIAAIQRGERNANIINYLPTDNLKRLIQTNQLDPLISLLPENSDMDIAEKQKALMTNSPAMYAIYKEMGNNGFYTCIRKGIYLIKHGGMKELINYLPELEHFNKFYRHLLPVLPDSNDVADVYENMPSNQLLSSLLAQKMNTPMLYADEKGQINAGASTSPLRFSNK
jgi:hypothetical protein